MFLLKTRIAMLCDKVDSWVALPNTLTSMKMFCVGGHRGSARRVMNPKKRLMTDRRKVFGYRTLRLCARGKVLLFGIGHSDEGV